MRTGLTTIQPRWPTMTGTSPPASPCVDRGDNAAVPLDTLDLDGDGDTAEQLPFDLDWRFRFYDDPDMVDLGVGTPPIVDVGGL